MSNFFSGDFIHRIKNQDIALDPTIRHRMRGTWKIDLLKHYYKFGIIFGGNKFKAFVILSVATYFTVGCRPFWEFQ